MGSKKKIKVLVLMGGPSQEHEVSLSSGREVLRNIDKRKYEALPTVISKRGTWFFPQSRQKFLPPVGKSGIASKYHAKLAGFSKNSPVVAFIAVHGAFGEDGTLQGILEAAGIPYTGSGVLASALGMDKPRSLAIFREAGLNVPEFEVLSQTDVNSRRGANSREQFPIVVKPANHGSSVGVHIVKTKKELAEGIKDAFRYSDRVILQKFIPGREMTCGVLEMNGKLFPLPPTEIIPKKGKFFDYKSKYDEGGSEHVVPPRNLTKDKIREIQDAAVKAHGVLGCSGMSRSDFILRDDGKLYILEINTIPGMTSTSLLPEAARAMGISFSGLLDIIITSSLNQKRKKGQHR